MSCLFTTSASAGEGGRGTMGGIEGVACLSTLALVDEWAEAETAT